MNPTTGQQIGQDISAAEPIISSFIGTLNPAIGEGVHLGLKLLAVAEPAVYNALAAALQGTDLTDQQKADQSAAIGRLQNPASYFE